jgi:signal transduction histidine kinase
MSRLISVVQELSLARNLHQIVDAVRCAARQLTGADGAAFILREGEYVRYVAESAISPLWEGRRFPLESCVGGWAISQRRPLVVADVCAEEHAPVEHYRRTFVKSLVAVPIRSTDPLGAIAVYWARRHRCTADELMLLEALANTTAVSIENVQLWSGLEGLVAERTRDLKAANEELEAFTSAASHDLRAPLRSMSAAVDLLEVAPPEEARMHTERLRKHLLTMNRLIEDLLRLSRVSRSELRRERCDLGEIARSILERLQLTYPDRRVLWRIAGDLTVNADPGLMRVALDNLLSNAWKYSAQREQAVISFTAHTGVDGRSVFTVSDNGAGFDERDAHRLFKPFQRLHSEREFSGTGLGLATVQRVIERHGGVIWATGAVGCGAQFRFTLDA